MNIDKLKDYFEEFITVAIKSKEHLEVFFDSVGDNMAETEKEFIRDLWDIRENGGDMMEVTEDNLLDMTKDELEDYAIDEFGVDIDKRHSIADLIEEVIELKEQKED
jgi:hypothetical protein